MMGLSPRVRGNPAGAVITASSVKVYPRACGGTPSAARPMRIVGGLSPRVRGNRLTARPSRPRRRSIPARAGEPGAAVREDHLMRVYPRACGGTADELTALPSKSGLSPRVRGNLGQVAERRYHLGSIPARAGEPEAPPVGTQPPRVYPRACGGTVRDASPGIVL